MRGAAVLGRVGLWRVGRLLGLAAACGLACGPGGAQTVPGTAGTSLPPLSAPTPALGNAATLQDGQRLTVEVRFAPGADNTVYPPLTRFPAYYPMLGGDQPFSLSVQTLLPGAALVLRAAPLPVVGQGALSADRIEYSVNGAPFQPCQAAQVIALLPDTGQGVYVIRLRLRLDGDEPAGLSTVLLSWGVEAR